MTGSAGAPATPVRITSAAAAHPRRRLSGDDTSRYLQTVFGVRRPERLVRSTRIEQRALAVTPEELDAYPSIERRNRLYQRLAPPLAARASTRALCGVSRSTVRFIATSSCTGYSLPGLSVRLSTCLDLPADAARLPITEAGCAGGVVGIARAADHLLAAGDGSALAVSSEICSLAFHVKHDADLLRSALVFGDGAGAALLQAGAGPGFEIVDAMSLLVPGTEDVLGFDLRDAGLTPVLRRELVDIVAPATRRAASSLLDGHGVAIRDLSAVLVHPGGARILERLQDVLGVESERMRWSWQSLREYGNTSSAAIFDVLRRAFCDPPEPGWCLAAAFGPGVSLELLLLRWAP